MKYAKQRWIGTVAICLGLAGPAWGQQAEYSGVTPVFGEEAEASVVLSKPSSAPLDISDATASVRTGQSASGSAGMNQQAQYVPPPVEMSPYVQGQAGRPYQPNFQEAAVPFDDGVGFAQTNRNINDILWRVGRINGDQYGINGGYTDFNAFVPLWMNGPDSVTFFNPRVGVTDYGFGYANVGLGHRVYMPSRDRVLGASFWYDFDNGHAVDFNQLGVSLESIGRYVSWRGNASIPVGRRKALNSFYDGAQSFTGNNISVLRNYIYDNAYQNYDMEVAFPSPVMGRYGFETGVGMYFLNGDVASDATGVSVRQQAQVTENLWINGYYTYDHVFESMFSLNFEVTMPDGRPRKWFRKPRVDSYLTQSVHRKYRVAVGKTTDSASILGRDANGNVITIAYIDPDAAGPGDGTIENPYSSTTNYGADANPERYQFIFVRRGTEVNEAANLNTGITLVDYLPSDPSDPGPPAYGQKLIGDVDLPLSQIPQYLVNFDGVNSLFRLPSESNGGTGAAPTLSNFGGTDVVTLTGNGHEVFGLTIDGALSDVNSTANANGISTGAGLTTDGFYLHGLTFQNVVNGITINSDTDPGVPSLDYHEYGRITNNRFIGLNADTGLPGLSERAIQINHTDGDLNLLVADNTINDFQTGANSGGIFVTADGANARINGVSGIPGSPELGVVRNTVGTSGSGIVLLADNGAEFFADVEDNVVTDSTELTGFGFSGSAENGSTMGLFTFNNNSFTGGEGTGARLNATAGSDLFVGNPDPTIEAPMIGNTFDNNDLDGLQIISDASVVQIEGIGDGTVANRNTFNGNGDNGLNVAALAGGTVTVIDDVVNQQFNNNGNNGLLGVADGAGSQINMAIGDTTVGSTLGNTFNNNGATTLTGDGSGLNLTASNGGAVTGPILHNTANLNAGSGIQLTANGGTIGTLAAPMVLGNNTMNQNAENGLLLRGDGAGVMNIDSILNRYTNNTENGISTELRGSSTLVLDSQGDTITGNTLAGVTARNIGTSDYTLNMIGATVQNNQRFGIMTNALEDSTYTMNIGTIGEASNSITGNTDVGVGVFSDNQATGVLNVRNSEITGTINGPTAGSLFNGEGISAVLRGSSVIDGVVQANNVSDNQGSGIRVTTTGNNLATFSTVNSFLIGGATADLGNIIENNGANGIEFVRQSNGRIGTVSPVRIQMNQIESNTLNGVFLSAQNAQLQDNYEIIENNIVENGANGVHLDVRADAGMRVDIDRNFIDSNTFDGILTTEVVNFPSDARFVTGDWTRNSITNNLQNGINLTSVTGDSLIGDRLNIGRETGPTFLTDPAASFGNLIQGNGIDGINITGATDVSIGNNLIDNNALHGIDIGGVFGKDIRIVANDIVNNGFGANAGGELGDGIEYQNNSNGTNLLAILGNNIAFNSNRGIDILNQGSSRSFVSIDENPLTGRGNTINSNGGEGIYVVNTASTTQNQSSPTPYDENSPSKGMNADGALRATAFLDISINNSLIVGNGFNSSFRATGVVVRSGTTGGGYGFTDAGGFATDGRGGIVMEMVDNVLGGNFGDDIYIESFVSTVAPGATQGTWNGTEFTVTFYEGDSLSRLDLTYRNNVREAASVTVTGAYFNNDEANFKSRTFGRTAPDPNGPFNSGTRFRNAQRQGLRDYPGGGSEPPAGSGAGFRYAGLGDSTFRINLANSDSLFDLALAGFIMDDNSPIQGPGDRNGVFYPAGEMQTPWGWGSF
ncbi:beta strand repeat-containing protein [Planctomicrobium sp. SH668]|uniref:beta strand repeat-containing protein n=1 Tax=Planctomicrobium sp. SH668 TaxID=3448126 RepID=UPI003F5BDFF5